MTPLLIQKGATMNKANYFIANVKGFEAVKGYTFDVVYGEEKYKFGIRNDPNHKWCVDFIDNGCTLTADNKTKAEAIASITYELMDKFESVLDNPNHIKRVELLNEYRASHAFELAEVI